MLLKLDSRKLWLLLFDWLFAFFGRYVIVNVAFF